MDLILLIGIASALFVIFLTLYFFHRKSEGKAKQQDQPRQHRGQIQEGIPRRAQIARNQRNRLRQNAAAAEAHSNDPDNDHEFDNEQEGRTTHAVLSDEKMGAKKRAKLEAKEQKRLQREQEMRLREEKKSKEAKFEEEQKKIQEKQAEIERQQEEAQRLAREERERKEQEEYMKMKAAFSIEEEGFEEDDDEKENLLADFIQYVKDNKVVVLEDLASEFKLKTQQAIDRITELQSNGTLTGVIDDRGKFIYISEDELCSVAKFIKQRGRVSIAELAESSNQLINLAPVVES